MTEELLVSDLKFNERTKLEALLGMSTGYVLDFSDRTLQSFIVESVDRDIFDAAYEYRSNSKANRLRAFWSSEPNNVVGKLISDLLVHAQSVRTDIDESLLNECESIVSRLGMYTPDAVTPKLVWKGRIGGGAHSDIWEAVDDLGRRVAVKLYTASFELMGNAVSNARALARVNHDNIVNVYFVHDVQHPEENRVVTAVVMEFLEGFPLRDLLVGELISVDRCRSVGMQMISGLTAIHEAGLTHSDLHELNPDYS
jgi:hypothetical protein